MTDERATTEARIFRLLGDVPALIERGQAAQLGVRRPGSLEALDRDSPVGEHAGVLASMKLAVAGDHLLAFYLIAHGTHRLPTWSHLSLLRGATEGSILSRWLTDGDVGSAVRVARGVGRLPRPRPLVLSMPIRRGWRGVRPAATRAAMRAGSSRSRPRCRPRRTSECPHR